MKPIIAFSVIVLALLLLLFAITGAHATPLTGSFEAVGNWMPVPGPVTPGGGVLLTDVTALDFIACNGAACVPPPANPVNTPGVAGEFKVTSGTGTFLGFVDHVGNIKDLDFTTPVLPIGAFEIVGLLTFDLSTLAIVTQTPSLLQLAGTGVFHLPGFDDTFGTWSFLGQQTCVAGLCPPGYSETFVFSSLNSIAAVPEPSVLLLIGVGLVGLAALVRARQ